MAVSPGQRAPARTGGGAISIRGNETPSNSCVSVESNNLLEKASKRKRHRARSAADVEKSASAVEPERLLERIGEPRSVRETSAVIVGGSSGEQRLVPLPLEPLAGHQRILRRVAALQRLPANQRKVPVPRPASYDRHLPSSVSTRRPDRHQRFIAVQSATTGSRSRNPTRAQRGCSRVVTARDRALDASAWRPPRRATEGTPPAKLGCPRDDRSRSRRSRA